MRSIATDVGYAVRMFVKKPGFALTAIFTLALGIGAAAAIFSVMNAVLLKPLPYADPERLVHVTNDLRARNVQDFPWPGPDFHDLRTTATQFEGLAGVVTGGQVFVTPGRTDAEPVTGGATPNLFRVLGARMAMGSDFGDADGTPPPPQPEGAQADGPPQNQNPPRTILSHEFWQRRFGADASVVGKVVRLGEQPFEIIGVLEPGFELLYPPGINSQRAPDVWTPLAIDFSTGSRNDVAR